MNTAALGNSLPTLFAELIDGAPLTEAYMINRGDAGLLRSLDKLSATAASKLTPNGSSIAAHAEHLRYGLSLMNRWAAGENPFDDADWSASWREVPEMRRLGGMRCKRGDFSQWRSGRKTSREMESLCGFTLSHRTYASLEPPTSFFSLHSRDVAWRGGLIEKNEVGGARDA